MGKLKKKLRKWISRAQMVQFYYEEVMSK